MTRKRDDSHSYKTERNKTVHQLRQVPDINLARERIQSERPPPPDDEGNLIEEEVNVKRFKP